MPWQIHAAQSTVEFHEITRRHGVTPIQWLDQLGVLGDTSIVGHGIFLDDYPRNAWHSRSDLALLAETGTTVAHCPTVFLRRGIALKDFGRYLRAGVNIGHRHRHLSAQHARGDALRRLCGPPAWRTIRAP